ncbi:MAG: hypothetical protein JXR64_01885 [Spirochaetales bacterium]|nr:hypothetical protein [Spirochaetales bacterium]
MKKIIMFVLSLILLMSCATKISDLKSNPEKYVGEIVKVRGNVNKLVKIPFTDYSFLEIGDDTDNILVFTLKEHEKNEVITMSVKVVGFDSSNPEKSTKSVIDSIEKFILDNIKIDESKVKKTAEVVGSTISKALNASNATYFLIEQEK